MRKREARDSELARLADYLENQTQKHLLPTIAYARGMADRQLLSVEQRTQIHSMITILEEVVQLFLRPASYRLTARLKNAHQRVYGALTTLSTYDSDETGARVS